MWKPFLAPPPLRIGFKLGGVGEKKKGLKFEIFEPFPATEAPFYGCPPLQLLQAAFVH